MFIKASQRQKNKHAAASPLTLHRDLASERARRSRLLVCSSLALALSLAAWLFDLSLTLHLALVAVGFLAGFAWRSERTEPWALRWIDERAGLAYRTALERTQAEPAARGDRYGFLEALSAQVERTAGRLEPPTAQPWWLPLLAVALSLAVLPAISLPGVGGGPGGGNAPLGPNGDAPPAAQSEADSRADSAEQDAADVPDVENAAQDAQPELERTFDAPGEDSSGEGGETGAAEDADSETLERYLESLDAQEDEAPPRGSGAERNPFAREAQGEQSAEQNAEPNQSQSDAPSEGQRQSQQGQGEQEGQQGQGAQEGEQGAQQEGNEDGNAQDGEEGASGSAPEQTEAPREGESEEGGSEGTPSEQEQEAEGEQPQSAQGESESQQEGQPQEEGQGSSGQSEGEPTQGESAQGGSAGSQEGEQDGGSENVPEGEEGDGSGSLPSASTPSSAERLEGTRQTNPELLEGQRSAGTTNAAGETLAPGSDDVDIPNAQTNAQYERAAEEAINEGRIPVEYQDILRDYFR